MTYFFQADALEGLLESGQENSIGLSVEKKASVIPRVSRHLKLLKFPFEHAIHSNTTVINLIQQTSDNCIKKRILTRSSSLVQCDVGERCAMKHGPRIGRLCDCMRGTACNTFFLRCYWPPRIRHRMTSGALTREHKMACDIVIQLFCYTFQCKSACIGYTDFVLNCFGVFSTLLKIHVCTNLFIFV